MQELYDDVIPGITERQGRYAESVAQRLAGVADVRFVRPVRTGVTFSVITGDWQSAEFERAFEDWARAAQAVSTLRRTRIGLLGYPMNGMGDILYDPPAMLRRIGATVVAEDLGPMVARIAE